MIRLPYILTAAAAAAAAAMTPAIVGLHGNPSFSEQVPVRAPAHTSAPRFVAPERPATSDPEPERPRRDDHGGRTSDGRDRGKDG